MEQWHVTMSPSYVTSGVPNTALPYSSETAAVVFNVEVAKLNGSSLYPNRTFCKK